MNTLNKFEDLEDTLPGQEDNNEVERMENKDTDI